MSWVAVMKLELELAFAGRESASAVGGVEAVECAGAGGHGVG